MSRIQSVNTAPELAVRRALAAAGIRYRLHDPGLPGRPDITIRRSRVVIFVDGCFWHGCPRHYSRPHVRQEYWDAKIASNRARRKMVLERLSSDGWKAFQLWECEVREGLKGQLSSLIGEILARGVSPIKEVK